MGACCEADKERYQFDTEKKTISPNQPPEEFLLTEQEQTE